MTLPRKDVVSTVPARPTGFLAAVGGFRTGEHPASTATRRTDTQRGCMAAIIYGRKNALTLDIRRETSRGFNVSFAARASPSAGILQWELKGGHCPAKPSTWPHTKEGNGFENATRRARNRRPPLAGFSLPQLPGALQSRARADPGIAHPPCRARLDAVLRQGLAPAPYSSFCILYSACCLL